MIVQSLWVGSELSRMEYYSILSFLNLGYTFHLYTYENVKNVPKGTTIMDGNKIMPAIDIFTLQESYLPFADIFRYKMLYENGGYWVDLDMIAIKPFDFNEDFVFSSERTIQGRKLGVPFASYKKFVPNIGVLKAPKHSEFYKELYEKCMILEKDKKNKDKLRYMRVLRDMIDKYNYGKYVRKPIDFCHLDWWYAKDAFIPNKELLRTGKLQPKYHVPGKSIKSMFTSTYTVHFWRDLVSKKYKLDLNGIYNKGSLWELMIANVENNKRVKRGGTRKVRKTTRIGKKTRNSYKTKKTGWKIGDCVAPIPMWDSGVAWYRIVEEHPTIWILVQEGIGGGSDAVPKSLEHSPTWEKRECPKNKYIYIL